MSLTQFERVPKAEIYEVKFGKGIKHGKASKRLYQRIGGAWERDISRQRAPNRA